MNSSPILIVPGEKKSVFFEIFFKSLKSKIYSSPLILICDKKNLDKELKKYNFNRYIEQIKLDEIYAKGFHKKKIYVIHVQDKDTKNYVHNCFRVAFKLIKEGITQKMINGPINKTKTLKKKYLGMTEYIAKNFNTDNFAMLIYNEKLSVCPLTTHLPLKMVHKSISKNKIISHVKLITNFYQKMFRIKPKIGITGLNPHCESNFNQSEEDKIIIPAIKYLSKKNLKFLDHIQLILFF